MAFHKSATAGVLFAYLETIVADSRNFQWKRQCSGESRDHSSMTYEHDSIRKSLISCPSSRASASPWRSYCRSQSARPITRSFRGCRKWSRPIETSRCSPADTTSPWKRVPRDAPGNSRTSECHYLNLPENPLARIFSNRILSCDFVSHFREAFTELLHDRKSMILLKQNSANIIVIYVIFLD